MAQREIKAGSAFILLELRDKTQAMLTRAARRFKKFSTDIGRIGTRALAIGGALSASLTPAIMAASKMQETMSKFDVVFGKNAERMKAFSDQMARTFGRSKRQMAEFLSSAQDLFVPLGFDPAQAEELSKIITELSIDLASFNNVADADTFRDLQAAVTGSGEVMKKYGVLLNEAAVKQQLLNRNLDPKTATDQQKVMARLTVILRGTTAAQGDAIWTIDSFSNQMKRAKASIENIAGTIGQALLPALTDTVQYFNRAFVVVEKILSQNKGLVLGFAAAATGITVVGAVLVAVSSVALGASFIFLGLASAITTLSTAIGVLTSPITIVTALVVVLGRRILFHATTGGKALKWLSARFGELRDFVLPVIEGIGDALAGGDLRLAAQIAMTGIESAWTVGMGTVQKIWDLALHGMQNSFDEWSTKIQQGFDDVIEGWTTLFQRVTGLTISPEGVGIFDWEGVDRQIAQAQEMADKRAEKRREQSQQRMQKSDREFDIKQQAKETELAETLKNLRDALENGREQAKQSRQRMSTQFDQFKHGKFVPPDFNFEGVGSVVQNIRARGTFGSLLSARQGFGTTQDIPKQQLDQLKEINNKLGQVEENTREGNEFG